MLPDLLSPSNSLHFAPVLYRLSWPDWLPGCYTAYGEFPSTYLQDKWKQLPPISWSVTRTVGGEQASLCFQAYSSTGKKKMPQICISLNLTETKILLQDFDASGFKKLINVLQKQNLILTAQIMMLKTYNNKKWECMEFSVELQREEGYG